MATSDNIGVLNGTPGWPRRSISESVCSRRSLTWRSPISSVCNRRSPELRHSHHMWVLGDQVVRNRRKGQGNSFPEHAWYAREADCDSGRRDHREGVQDDTPYSPLKGSRSKVSWCDSTSTIRMILDILRNHLELVKN